MSVTAVTGTFRRSRLLGRSERPEDHDGAGAPRFMLYSHDGLGLGHVRRNLVIAGALVARNPAASVLLATSAEHADSLGVPDGVELLQIPGVRKVANGRYTPRRLPIPGADLTAIRSAILAAAVESYQPSVLLVDKHPMGVGGELGLALRRLRGLGGRAVLGLRDVLDDPATVREEWTPERTRIVLQHYGRVLVYGKESVFDTLRGSALPRELAARSTYCGYVTMPVSRDPESKRVLQAFAGPRTRPIVLGTTGGGEDGKRVLEAFIEASDQAPWEAIVVLGPQLAPGDARFLRSKAAAAGVAVRTFVPELAGWFGVVDAVVCMGGYNTLAEALLRGAPTVCVPRVAPRTEQLIRARALAELGLVQVVEPQRLTAQALRLEVESALTRSRPTIARAARRALVFDGADAAAEALHAEVAHSSVERAA